MDTHVYIDGFNLFYGLLRGTPYKWLDLERFCDQLLPRNRIVKIHYFTAKVDARPHDPDQPTRQLAYLQALATLPRVEVHLGTFMSSVVNQVVVDSDPVTGRYLRVGGKPVPKTDQAGNLVKTWVLKSEEKVLAIPLISGDWSGRSSDALLWYHRSVAGKGQRCSL